MLIPIETLLIFTGASAILALTPGPDNLFVLAQSAIHGRRAGIIITLGLCTGLVFHTLGVTLGVATLMQSSSMAFNLLKYLGALYLIYLAFQAFKATAPNSSEKIEPVLNDKQLYQRGVIMNISNPKVAIFFLAFFPQFTHSSAGSISTQMLILGGVFISVALMVFSSFAWLAGTLGSRLRESSRAQEMMNKITGLIMLALAIRLALSEI